MKFLMTIVALAMLAASPAFAAPSKHVAHQMTASKAYAAYPAQDPYAVVVDGQVVGRDPDPNIRFQILRDHGLQAD
jgi:hypothetical protein